MTMSLNEKRMLDREALRSVIQQWNANRLDLFELSEPNDMLEFHGVMRFYFQDIGQKVATKCIRVASDATVADVIETLIEKFRPDMRMLSVPNYALYEVHANGEERKLNPDEKPLLVQLNWHVDDREGRFLLKDLDQKANQTQDNTDTNFKRKLSKREKKEQKKKEKLQKLQSNNADSENHVAEKLYTELPETSFTRSISNPEAVMRRRRQQKLEKKLQQFRSRDGGPDTGGTLKIYGESLCRDVPYKTLLLSIRDCAQAVVREMLAKYGMDKVDPLNFCLVQVNSDLTEYILDDDECPLSILMNHPTSRGSIMFHVRRRPADQTQPRRRKKKPMGIQNGSSNITSEREGPVLIEITHSGDGGRRLKLTSEPVEVGSANTNALQLFGPSIQPRHCLISLHEGVCTVTPLHADGLTFVNGHHITQPTILHNGSVVMFGRAASYRFVDIPTDGRYNLALSQSQLDSAYLYEKSSTNTQSWLEEEEASIASSSYSKKQPNYAQKPMQQPSSVPQHPQPQQTNMVKPPLPSTFDTQSQHNHNHQQQQHSPGSTAQPPQQSPDEKSLYGENDGANLENNETKSVSSLRSGASLPESRSQQFAKPPSGMSATPTSEPQGQEPILPAVLEFPEHHQEPFLKQVISELDVNSPNFKLAPVYTLYLCARYRASTHYRPDLQPTERAHKLTVFLHHVANLIHSVIQEKYNDPKILSFWMANSSEFLHFLKSDRHISAFSVQAQEVLAECVQTAFQNLVSIFHSELSQTLNQFLSENIDHDSAAGLVLSVLGSAMALLRRCRVNAALTIQLFSQLFHYINVVCFNKFVTTSHMCTSVWGKALSDRLSLLELWAEKQGLELAADCHLAKINQCAEFLQAPKTNVTEVQQLACSCFRLNSLQMGALLSQETIPRSLIDATVRMAESVADELTRADGREIRLEESPDLPLALLLPVDGFSCDVVRGIPAGLVDFLSPFQVAGMCRLASQPTSIGMWTVYMHQFNGRSPSVMSSKMPQPEVQTIKLHKNSNGMGLSIVAAKGAGQERLGIYIKSVVGGGAADLDGRLQAGDQLLRVDGQSLIGITQERAADYLVRTGPVVSLEVAKQGAIFHGLATLLQQPSPVIQRDDDLYRSDSDESLRRFLASQQQLHEQPAQSTISLNHLSYNADPFRRLSNPDIYPGARRYSTSFSREDILSNDQLDQIKFDPRYRDYRSASSLTTINNNLRSRSNSLCSVGSGGGSTANPYRRRSTHSPMHNMLPVALAPTKRWDTTPAIFIEEYKEPPVRSEPKSESHHSRETMFSSNESMLPLSETDMKSIGDFSEIPFIDDDSNESAPCRLCDDVDDDNESAKKSSIIKNGNGERRDSCRKTVSFDVIAGAAEKKEHSHMFHSNGGRRMSERDMTRIGTDPKGPNTGPQLLNSKSVPALHHIGNTGTKSRSIHNLAGNGNGATDQGFYQNLSVYRAQNQSQPNLGDNRSNLQMNPPIAPISNNIMQNQSTISSSSATTTNLNNIMNRPSSAYFNNSNTSNVNSSTLSSSNTNQQATSNSTSNLLMAPPNAMSFMQANNGTTPHQHISHPNLSGNIVTQQRPPMLPNKMPGQVGPAPIVAAGPVAAGGGNFMRESQSQHSLRMNQQQMMAPSMPNIAHASGYASNISASQSMQNVNQMAGNYPMYPQHAQQFHDQQQQFQVNPQPSPIQIQQQQQQQQQASLLRGSAKMAEMGELLKRRNQQQLTNGIMHTNSMDNISTAAQQQHMHIPNPMLSPNPRPPQPTAQNYHPQSPQKPMPPTTAPKPQRHPMDQIDQPPLPPSSTHPLFKNQVGGPPQQMAQQQQLQQQQMAQQMAQQQQQMAQQQQQMAQQQQQLQQQQIQNLNYSTSEAPKSGYYPPQQGPPINKSSTSNPWEREEREKDQELRREQIRQWRDQQIVELSLLPSRSQQQEEQLKTLVLERDFERRALEEENEEERNEYDKNSTSMQEVLRLQPGNGNSGSVPASQITTPQMRLKQVDIKTTPTNISPNGDIQNEQQVMNSNPGPPVQPKSILKHNSLNHPTSPSKHNKTTSFATKVDTKTTNLSEITMNNTNANQLMMTQMIKGMDQMTMEYQGQQQQQQQEMLVDDTNGPMPPPPPERNSSYVIMHQQKIRNSGTFQQGQAKIAFNDQVNNNNNNTSYNNKYVTTPATMNNNEHSPMMLSPTGGNGNGNGSSGFTTQQLQQQMNLINNNVNRMEYGRDKRVSFHDHENNNLEMDQAEFSMMREDPNRFIDETQAMLQSPTTPESDNNWSIQVQSTPGVIGAQEVYRDPRQRRLAEAQKAKVDQQPIPEKLTFKEKMKMFALESGEDQTPKDKLKISRAQRDIDAVH